VDTQELDTLVASLEAAKKSSPSDASIILDYQRVFGTEPGGRVLADLVKRFPLIAPRFVSGQGVEQAAQRDGAAQVVAHILQYTISKPRQERKKAPAKRAGRQKETKEDIQ